MEVFFTTLNLVLLVTLAAIYVQLYRDLPNKYTASLLCAKSRAAPIRGYVKSSSTQRLRLPPRPNIGAFVFLPTSSSDLPSWFFLYQSQT